MQRRKAGNEDRKVRPDGTGRTGELQGINGKPGKKEKGTGVFECGCSRFGCRNGWRGYLPHTGKPSAKVRSGFMKK